MDKTCNPEKLYERKHPRNSLPLSECKQCLFNVLCNDYIIHEESNDGVQEVLKVDGKENK